METSTADTVREPWNKGKLVGQKAPFKLKEIWAIRKDQPIAERPPNATKRNNMSPDMTPTGVR